MEIGFIGLGNMGFPIACRILGENHDVIAFDTRSDALERVVALGAQAANSAKEVADRAETVMASLPSPGASLEVATGATGVIEGSRVKRYVDLSTVGSPTAVQIHDLLAERNVVAIDSRVSGGVSGAEKGHLPSWCRARATNSLSYERCSKRSDSRSTSARNPARRKR